MFDDKAFSLEIDVGLYLLEHSMFKLINFELKLLEIEWSFSSSIEF